MAVGVAAVERRTRRGHGPGRTLGAVVAGVGLVTGLAVPVGAVGTATAATPLRDPAATTVAAPRAALPGAPTNVRARPGSNRATVTWTAPAGAEAAGVLAYRVQKSTDGGVRWTSVVGSPVDAPATRLVVVRLSNNRTYRFRVAAENAAGVGPWSAPSSTVRPSERPPGKLATFSGTSPRAGTIRLTWTPPSTGPRPTRYDYRYRKGFGTFTRWRPLPASARSVVITGLVRRADYLCQVRAVNGQDVGPTNTRWVRTR